MGTAHSPECPAEWAASSCAAWALRSGLVVTAVEFFRSLERVEKSMGANEIGSMHGMCQDIHVREPHNRMEVTMALHHLSSDTTDASQHQIACFTASAAALAQHQASNLVFALHMVMPVLHQIGTTFCIVSSLL